MFSRRFWLRIRLPLNLRLRLLLANLLVMMLSLSAVAAIAYFYKSEAFPNGLSQLAADSKGDEGRFSDGILVLFGEVNSKGTILALSISFISVGVLSCWLSRSITRPLQMIERSVKQFNSGDLNARVPPSRIPELHQLGLTLNSAANRLQDVEERRQEMISDLAHELGAPLTVLRGYLEMLEEETISLTPQIRRQLHEEAKRMNRLLEDLKTLSRIEAGSLPLRLQPFNPKALLEEVVSSLAASNPNPSCQLTLDCPARVPDIFADPDRVRQILLNLIGNAVRYTPTGSVTVRIWATCQLLWIVVIDTGIGISSADLPHVFERFWRSPEFEQLELSGSGIGLAITKRLVEVQGGQIEVESELGRGSTFRCCLPLACLERE